MSTDRVAELNAIAARVRTCTLGQSRLDAEAAWLERYRELWDARFGALDQVIEQLQQQERDDASQ